MNTGTTTTQKRQYREGGVTPSWLVGLEVNALKFEPKEVAHYHYMISHRLVEYVYIRSIVSFLIWLGVFLVKYDSASYWITSTSFFYL